MFCYIINFVLWMLNLFICNAIICFGFEFKNKKKKRWQGIVGLSLAQFPFLVLKYLFNENDMIRNVAWILTTIACFVYMIIAFEGYLWQKLLFIVFEAICCVVSETIIQLIMQEELIKLEDFSFNQPIMVLYLMYGVLLISVLFLLFLFVWKRIFSKGSYNLRIYFVFCIFPISQIIMMTSVNVKIYKEMQLAGMINIVGLLVSIAADVLLLVTLLRQQSLHEMEIRLSETEKAWEVEQNHYRDIESRREEFAKIRHDLTEQFIVIQELLHKKEYEKAGEMVGTLQEYVLSTKEYTYCADPVINAILAENEKLCREKSVLLDYDLEILQPLKLNPVVICSIFSNLMKNAIAAASKVEKDKQPTVSVKAAVKGDYLHIRVDNTYTEAMTEEKRERKGYGLSILRTIAEKYNGKMEVLTENCKYSTRMSVENMEKNEMYPSL